MPDAVDRELLQRFVQGDEAAFESLFRQFEAWRASLTSRRVYP